MVSASYVKGAYNDAIAAVNKVNADKQDKLYDNETGYEISNAVLDASAFNDLVDAGENHSPSSGAWQNLVSAQAIANQIAKTKLLIYDSESSEFIPIALTVQDDIFNVDGPDILVNGMAVQNAINSVNNTISAKRVSAVTTWGNDTPTKLQLTNQ